MEKSSSVVFSAILVLSGTIYVIAYVGYLKNCSGSTYIFYKSNDSNMDSWLRSKGICERSRCNLVSIESLEEWNFLNQTIQRKNTTEYFIGLRKDTSTGKWRWLSDNSTLNVSDERNWPWAEGEPNSEKENCAQMYKNYRDNYGLYNDIDCSTTAQNAGFICECKYGAGNRPSMQESGSKNYGRHNDIGCSKSSKDAGFTCECRDEPGLTDESQATQTTRFKEFPRTTATTHSKLYSRIKFETDTVTEYPLADDVHTSKPNLVVVVVVLFAIFILILFVTFGLMFFRRHQRHSKQCKDRVICTYEKPLSTAQTSLDPELVQQTQSSTELTVHLTLSRTESEMATYETVSDCKKEREYNDTDETHRTSRSVSEMCSDVQERERKNTLFVSDEKGIEQAPSLYYDNEENKDHVYAVVHKERKSRASSEGSALKKPSGRPQKGTTGLPENRASCVGLEDYTKAAMNETPQAGENTEYLYAVVDKKDKKKKQPQMPPPYHDLVYVDLIHSRENSAKLVKEQSQVVYADHVKTAFVKISQQNLEETKNWEH